MGLSTRGENAAAGQGKASLDAAQTDTSAANQQASIYGDLAKGLGNIGNNFANQSLYQQKTNALMTETPTVYNANGYGGDYGSGPVYW